MRRYNLLYTSLSGQTIGGGQKSLLLLLERLDRKKYNPFLICPSEGDLIEKVERLGIETALIKTGSLKNPNFFSTAATVGKFAGFIKKKDIDLIHTDAPRHTFYAGLAARLTKKPLVWHVRVSDLERKFYDKFLFSLATRVIAVSKAAGKRFERLAVKKDKVTVVYNGIDLTEFGAQSYGNEFKEEFEIESDCLLIGVSGQLLPKKGQDIFLRAGAQVLKLIPKIKLIIIGDGNEAYRKKLEHLSKELGISENVIFTGYREDIPQIMSHLDIFCLPSYYLEGFSRVILEAMASSKPVIATNAGGNAEAVEDGTSGMLIPPGDAGRLAEAILELVKNEDKRRRMGTAGRKKAENLFSIEKNTARIEKIYEELLCQEM
jgi:glycosyltransferase involved in cell wall biosynthesis